MKYQDSVALMIGSFDPFHEGHLHLLKLAQNNFKKVIICVACNENKINQSKLEDRQQQIISFLKRNNFKNEVIINNGLTINLCKKLKINKLVRGYRNFNDFQYEKQLLKQYRKHWKSIKFKLYKAKNHQNISSSNIKNKSINK